MTDIEIMKTPKYIVFDGNLYELKDTNIGFVTDVDKVLELQAKLKLKEQNE